MWLRSILYIAGNAIIIIIYCICICNCELCYIFRKVYNITMVTNSIIVSYISICIHMYLYSFRHVYRYKRFYCALQLNIYSSYCRMLHSDVNIEWLVQQLMLSLSVDTHTQSTESHLVLPWSFFSVGTKSINIIIICTYVYIYVHMYVSMYVCTYVRMYICICLKT